MPPIIIFGFWVTAIACTYLLLAESSFGFDMEEFFVERWVALLKAFAERFPKTDSSVLPPSEKHYLKELLSSLDSLNGKLTPLLEPARLKVANNITVQEQMNRALDKSRDRISAWHDRAKRAVDEGNDLLAKQAISKKLHYEREVEIYTELIEEDKAELEALRAHLAQIETTVNEVKRQTSSLMARAKAADASCVLYRTTLTAHRRAALSNIDMHMYHSQTEDFKESTKLSFTAMSGFSNLLKRIEFEVVTMEDNVANWGSYRHDSLTGRHNEAIQRELDELKKAAADDQLSG